MAKQFVKQHEPIRIPDKWRGSDRAFAIQLNRILDEVYALIGTLQQKIEELQPEGDDEE